MLRTSEAALLIIDVQGKLAGLMHERDKLYQNLRLMIQCAEILEIPMMWLEQIPEKLGATVPEIAELLTGMTPIPKTSFSAWGEPKFVDTLLTLGRRQLLLTGIETHICVLQTAVDLIQNGYEVQVVTDAAASRIPENKTVGLERMRQAGAVWTSVETAVFEMMQKAEGPQFREIVRLFR